jgi:DNA modification methylase
MTTSIFNDNCLELMKTLPDKSIDLFICDLPYGETNCKWDSIINLDEFWAEFRRLRKSKRVACIHFCSTKFGYTLIKSWEKGFKMDMVWKKRNKTGGLQSRHRPMRNHEMVYFFYEQSPKYNRDKYHKRIAQKKHDIEKEDITMGLTSKMGKPENHFDPPNPASVVEEDAPSNKLWGYNKPDTFVISKDGTRQTFEPPNPVSVLEEDERINEKGISAHGWNIEYMDKPRVPSFDPKLPVSVLEENEWKIEDSGYGWEKGGNYNFGTYGYTPKQPCSVFDSQKVFIGKRHHQTEKPLDILEFFLKYWSDEGDTILDPTMGSGSTGVACKELGRNFIGYELDPKIFEVAKKRLGIDENIVEI